MREVSKEDFINILPERERRGFLDIGFKAYVEKVGNFTVVAINQAGRMYCGVSKRNPTDLESDTGERVASVRAFRAMRGQDQGYNRQRPVSKRDARRAAARDMVRNALERDRDFLDCC